MRWCWKSIDSFDTHAVKPQGIVGGAVHESKESPQFERMGDIGYLCDSYEEMRNIVLSILREFPLARYQQQCENIRRGRRIFEPQALAPRLRAIVAAGK